MGCGPSKDISELNANGSNSNTRTITTADPNATETGKQSEGREDKSLGASSRNADATAFTAVEEPDDSSRENSDKLRAKAVKKAGGEAEVALNQRGTAIGLEDEKKLDNSAVSSSELQNEDSPSDAPTSNEELSSNKQDNAESRSEMPALKRDCMHSIRLPPLSSSTSEADRETESSTASGDPENRHRGENEDGGNFSPPSELKSEASIVSATVRGILEDVANEI